MSGVLHRSVQIGVLGLNRRGGNVISTNVSRIRGLKGLNGLGGIFNLTKARRSQGRCTTGTANIELVPCSLAWVLEVKALLVTQEKTEVVARSTKSPCGASKSSS